MDLRSIWFRFPTYAFSADLAKMYRQILVSESDKNLQLILWRNHPSEPFSVYRLNTVTKCLQQITQDVRQEFPIAAKLIRSDFYVDDVISGCNDLEEAIMTRKQLCKIFSRYGFHLRKWCSNNSAILDNIPE